MKMKEKFFEWGCFSVGNGEKVRFWEDTWLGDKPLSSQYPSLYRIAHRKEVTVASVLSPAPPINITFRRTLNGNRWNRWLQLLARLMEIHLNDNQDVFKWNLMASGNFTVKSLYLDYMSEHAHFNCKYLWKMKVPLKIKIFMWFLRRKVVLTKDNLAKQKWEGSKKSVVCSDQDETIQHFFIACPLAKMVWCIVHVAFNLSP